MRAMIFAAGLGTRLRPLTEKLPKCLIQVGGRPMIDYVLLLLERYGIGEIIVNIHHLGPQVEAYLRDGQRFGVEISYSRETILLDTGGGLLGAKEFLAGETFVVINSDVLIDLRLDQVIAAHQEQGAAATLVLRRDPMADAYGAIETDQRGRIERFLTHERPGRAAGPLEKYMFTGVHVIEPGIFEYMAGDSAFSITRTTYPRMLGQGEPLFGFRYDGKWQDLGTPETLARADQDLLSKVWQPHFLQADPK